VKELHGTTTGNDAVRTFMGRAVTRLEDHALLRGAGRFIDDIVLPGLLHA
jgi:CO/xanthine dehydrogenase Mo-binding subunit